jgi:class 3 adenylate cyclase
VFDLPGAATDVELWVQLANFEFRGGGIRRPWVVGRPDAIQGLVGRGILREALLCIVGLVVGVAYLAQFALRPAESARGYLGLFALVVGVRAIGASLSDLGQLVAPWASFATASRLEYLGTALAIFAGAGYFRVKIPEVTPPRTLRALQLVALALAPIEVFAPLSMVWATLPFFLVLPPVILGLVVICYARAWRRGVPGVGTTLVAAAAYLVIVTHDVLRAQLTGFGAPIEVFPYFLAVWILVEANGMLRDVTRTLERVESLAEELTEANFELQETEAAVVRFAPFEFLKLLGKRSIREVKAGDTTRSQMSAVSCALHPFPGFAPPSTGDEAFRILNDLFRHWEPVIFRAGGFVSHYLGKRFLALVPGAPDAAVAAAIGIHRAVRDFNAEGEREIPPRPAVEIGIGVDTGPLVLGTIGGDERLTSGAIGPAVDAAPRVEALALYYGARLLVTGATRDGLADPSTLALREIDSTALGADADPVSIWEVLDVDDEGTRERKLACLATFDRAQAALRAGEWTEAAAGFEACLAACPEDAASRVLAARCRSRSAGSVDWP